MIHLNKKLLVSLLALGLVCYPAEAKIPSHSSHARQLAHRRALREKKIREATFSIKDIPQGYMPAMSDNQPLTPEGYEADMLSILAEAKKAQKRYFEFDGTRYLTNEKEAKIQLKALMEARQSGQTTYLYRGKKHEACSGYSDKEQIDVFGNIWEELRSPQSAETKALLRLCVSNLVKSEEKILNNSSLTRLYEICRFGGYPEVKDGNKTSSLIDWAIRKSNGHNISHYEPPFMGGEIHIPVDQKGWSEHNTDDIIGELAHAVRQHMNIMGESFYFISDGIKDFMSGQGTGWNGMGYLGNYSKKDHMEADTHCVVENILKAYIFGETYQNLPSPSSLRGVFAFIREVRRAGKEMGAKEYMLTPSVKKQADQGMTEILGETEITFGVRRKAREPIF